MARPALRVQGLGVRVQGSGVRCKGLGVRGWGVRVRCQGCGVRRYGFRTLGELLLGREQGSAEMREVARTAEAQQNSVIQMHPLPRRKP